MSEPGNDPELQRLRAISNHLDNKFSLGSLKFGLDPILGLIPVAGDIAGLLVNSVLVRTLWKKGASPWIMLRLLGNQLLDVLVGLVPMLGDFLDIAHKAHRRNLSLLEAYYAEPGEKPSVFWTLGIFILLILGMLAGGIWLAHWLWKSIFG